MDIYAYHGYPSWISIFGYEYIEFTTIVDIHHSIMEKNMEIIMDIHNSIMDIHICQLKSPTINTLIDIYKVIMCIHGLIITEL